VGWGWGVGLRVSLIQIWRRDVLLSQHLRIDWIAAASLSLCPIGRWETFLGSVWHAGWVCAWIGTTETSEAKNITKRLLLPTLSLANGPGFDRHCLPRSRYLYYLY